MTSGLGRGSGSTGAGGVEQGGEFFERRGGGGGRQGGAGGIDGCERGWVHVAGVEDAGAKLGLGDEDVTAGRHEHGGRLVAVESAGELGRGLGIGGGGLEDLAALIAIGHVDAAVGVGSEGGDEVFLEVAGADDGAGGFAGAWGAIVVGVFLGGPAVATEIAEGLAIVQGAGEAVAGGDVDVALGGDGDIVAEIGGEALAGFFRELIGSDGFDRVEVGVVVVRGGDGEAGGLHGGVKFAVGGEGEFGGLQCGETLGGGVVAPGGAGVVVAGKAGGGGEPDGVVGADGDGEDAVAEGALADGVMLQVFAVPDGDAAVAMADPDAAAGVGGECVDGGVDESVGFGEGAPAGAGSGVVDKDAFVFGADHEFAAGADGRTGDVAGADGVGCRGDVPATDGGGVGAMPLGGAGGEGPGASGGHIIARAGGEDGARQPEDGQEEGDENDEAGGAVGCEALVGRVGHGVLPGVIKRRWLRFRRDREVPSQAMGYEYASMGGGIQEASIGRRGGGEQARTAGRLSDKSPLDREWTSVRAMAASSLGLIGEQSAKGTLTANLEGGDLKLKETCEWALAHLAGKAYGGPEAEAVKMVGWFLEPVE